MDNTKEYVKEFFDELEVFEDVSRGHMYKIFMRQAVINFLDDECPKTAFDVYRCFFDIYKIALENSIEPFIDLLDILKNYEENAAVLIDKQRDHYVHSVNVFVLGLCIYAKNKRYKESFAAYALDKTKYAYSYDTKNEEFFYRWGIASLFHDVGYPVEIVGKQVNKFVSFACDFDGNEEKIKVRLEYDGFDEFDSIKIKNPQTGVELESCTRLLADYLSSVFLVNKAEITNSIKSFVDTMGKSGFIDHGYFSSLIVLKWYGHLIQQAGYKTEYFFYPVLDCAAATFLHNCYRNMLQKSPFNLGPLNPNTCPIAFLLILCDELQEWNRTAYGIKDKRRVLPLKKELTLGDYTLDICYITEGNPMKEGFGKEKEGFLKSVLDMDLIFPDISIRCSVEGSLKGIPEDKIIPRPPLAIVEKLAKEVHKLYNKKQQERNPEKPLKYPDFELLDDNIKYSNLRQAMDIFEKVKLMGYAISPINDMREPLEAFPKALVEEMAKTEHQAWMAEKRRLGLDSPYMIPYAKLPEDIKQLDRDTIENIPYLLKTVGLGICK